MNSDAAENKTIVIFLVIAYILGLATGWLFFREKGEEIGIIDEGSDIATHTIESDISTKTTSSVEAEKENTQTKSVFLESESAEKKDSTPTFTVPPKLNSAENILRVEDQPAEDEVQLAELHLQEPTWIVVWEQKESRPWRILGAARYRAHNLKGIVELQRNTEPNKTYFVLLHQDNGDDVFDYKLDIPIRKDNGEYLGVTFRTIENQGNQ